MLRALALALAATAACGGQEPAPATASPAPPPPVAPVDCAAASPDGGACPDGCVAVEDRCLAAKGIIAPH